MEAPLRVASSQIRRFSFGRVRVAPVWSRNSDPSAGPMAEVNRSSAETAHSVGSPDGVIQMVAPVRNGSILERLMCTRYLSGDLKMSLRRSDRSSLLCRNPKKASIMAAQRFRWSKLVSIRKVRKVRSSVGVIWSLLSDGHPCTCLIPLIRRGRLRTSVVGSGSPCSRCMLRTADK